MTEIKRYYGLWSAGVIVIHLRDKGCEYFAITPNEVIGSTDYWEISDQDDSLTDGDFDTVMDYISKHEFDNKLSQQPNVELNGGEKMHIRFSDAKIIDVGTKQPRELTQDDLPMDDIRGVLKDQVVMTTLESRIIDRSQWIEWPENMFRLAHTHEVILYASSVDAVIETIYADEELKNKFFWALLKHKKDTK